MRDVAYFLALCFGLTYLIYSAIYALGGLRSPFALPLLLAAMFMPLASSAIVIKLQLRRKLDEFGIKDSPWRYYILSLAYPFAVVGLGLLVVALLGTARLTLSLEEFKRNLIAVPMTLRGITLIRPEELPPIALDIVFYVTLLLLPVAPFINAIPAFGEEYGWRGYLLQRLMDKCRPLASIVIVGIVWGLWHAPLILMGYNYPSHPDLVGISVFTLWTTLVGFFLAWLRVASGSVYPAALAHGAINAYMGLGLILAPSKDELMTVPLGLPTLPPLVALAIASYLGIRSRLSR